MYDCALKTRDSQDNTKRGNSTKHKTRPKVKKMIDYLSVKNAINKQEMSVGKESCSRRYIVIVLKKKRPALKMKRRMVYRDNLNQVY